MTEPSRCGTPLGMSSMKTLLPGGAPRMRSVKDAGGDRKK
jgi:hypothetical protein